MTRVDVRRRPTPHGAILTSLADVQPETVEWLWPARVPRGKLTVIEGDPGLGKSTLMLDLAARLSVGGTTPDGQPLRRAGTVLLTAEDGLADTVRPRIDSAGGDASRITALVAVNGLRGPDTVELPMHLAAVHDAIAVVGARLVIIDPLVAYLPGTTDSWRDQDMRRALRPLATLAEETGVALVVVRHLRKGSGPAIYRGGGSIGIVGAARSALLIARDPDDDARRVVAVVKSNLAPDPGSLAYYIEDDGHGRARVRWAGASPHRADALAAAATNDDRTATDRARDLLIEAMGDGTERPQREVVRDVVRAADVSERTVREAARVLGVVSRRSGFGRNAAYMWRLPNTMLANRGGIASMVDGDGHNPLVAADIHHAGNAGNCHAGGGGAASMEDDPEEDMRAALREGS